MKIKRYDSGRIETVAKPDVARFYNESLGEFKNRFAQEQQKREEQAREQGKRREEESNEQRRKKAEVEKKDQVGKAVDLEKKAGAIQQKSGQINPACRLSLSSNWGNSETVGNIFCAAELTALMLLLDIRTSRLQTEQDLTTPYMLGSMFRGDIAGALYPYHLY